MFSCVSTRGSVPDKASKSVSNGRLEQQADRAYKSNGQSFAITAGGFLLDLPLVSGIEIGPPGRRSEARRGCGGRSASSAGSGGGVLSKIQSCAFAHFGWGDPTCAGGEYRYFISSKVKSTLHILISLFLHVFGLI